MSKLKYLIIISILFFSCQNHERESLINKFSDQRKKNGLNSFDENLKLDSTISVKLDEDCWNRINHIIRLASYRNLKLEKDERASNFYIIDFYSNKENNQFKTVYYSDIENNLKLISEQDRFYKKLNDTIEIYLNHNFNYLKNETIYSIDSFPTKYFVVKNQKKLKGMYEYAKKNNLELCGTSANEILKRGFPENYSEINYTKFNKVKTELNR